MSASAAVGARTMAHMPSANIHMHQIPVGISTGLPRGAPAPAFRPVARSLRCSIRAKASAPAREVSTSEEIIPGSSSVRLTVTVPSEMCKKTYRAVMKEWNNKMAITGYRKGNAPEPLLIEQLGGIQRVYNTVMAELMESVLTTALETTPSGSRAIADSERVEQNGEELEKSFNPDQDFTFSVLFDTLPTITWTTPYKDLAVTVEAASDAEKDAATVEGKMRAVRKEGGQLRVVVDRGLQLGDVAIIDFAAAVAETGEAIPGAGREGMQLDTETADTAFLPGVAAAMEGMRAGDTRETTITLPDTDDFSPAALRGVNCAVKISVSEIFEWDLPEMTDEWASQVMGPGSTVADIRARLEENTAAESEDATRQKLADAFTDAVGAAVDVIIPDSLIQEAGQNQYTNELNSLLTQGILTYEQAEQLASPQMLSNFISNKKEDLISLQKAALGFADILAKEGIAPSEADIEKELSTALESIAEVQSRGGDIDVNAVKEQVARGLETQAAMDWLISNCNVTILPPGVKAGKAPTKKKAAPKKVEAKTEGGDAAPKKRGRPKKTAA